MQYYFFIFILSSSSTKKRWWDFFPAFCDACSPQLSLSLDVINASSVPAVARGSSNCVWATEPTNCKSRSIRLWCVGSSPCWNQLGLPIKSRKLHDQPFSSSSSAWQGMFFCDMYFWKQNLLHDKNTLIFMILETTIIHISQHWLALAIWRNII